MALALLVTVKGSVGPQVVRVLVNGEEVALTGRTYTAEVPVANGLVIISTIDAVGRERVRSLRMVTAATASA